MLERKASFHTRSPEETELLGERIGRAVHSGLVVSLIGELAAGKTVLTKGIARGLGVKSLIHSPTFTLIHEHQGRLPLYHFDLYRLGGREELEALGAEEYFEADGLTVIEWGEKATGMLPSDRLEIRIAAENSNRLFEITATGPISASVLDAIIEEIGEDSG